MDAALHCAHCGTPARGTRFCTSCGIPLPTTMPDVPEPAVEAASQPSANGSGRGQELDGATTVTAVLPASGNAVDGEPTPPWLAAQPVPQPHTRPNVVALLVVAALALSGWAIWRGVEQHTLSGSVLLVDSTYFGLTPGRPCSGELGYDDLDAGARVVLTDDKGKTLSTGRLSEGEFDGLGCVFSFALGDVPRADFYGLTIASESRGQLQYSYEELADSDWSVSLSLGED
jgi:hypothetical protein